MPRHVFLVLDDEHLHPGDHTPVFDAARAFLAGLEPSDRFAVATLQGGRLRPIVPFGTDVAAARDALTAFERKPSLGILLLETFEGPMRKARERSSFDLLERAVRAFGTCPGRKEMVFVSRGIDRYELARGSGNLLREFDRLVAQANRSRVTIHTIGAVGLTVRRSAGFT